MNWQQSVLEELRRQPICGYQPQATPATEPTALAALALAVHGEWQAAGQATDWLAASQTHDGSLGVRRGEPTPAWPTSLAVLAWLAVDAARYAEHIDAATDWTLHAQGEPLEPHVNVGHDTLLIAWPWVAGTHSWVEPTALHVLALKATGHADHPRCREAIQLLLDRQLLGGGCNYGNTRVLGQTLLPHVQPTGIAMLALADESLEFDPHQRDRIGRSLTYLKDAISAQTTTASLCWALLGLAAHDQRPQDTDGWLEAAFDRTRRRDAGPHKYALLALAACGEAQPLMPQGLYS